MCLRTLSIASSTGTYFNPKAAVNGNDAKLAGLSVSAAVCLPPVLELNARPGVIDGG